MNLMISVISIVLICLPPCFAENDFIGFTEAYNQLGFVAEKNIQENIDRLKMSLVNKNIKWTLTLKGVYPSGKPIFNETLKIINNTEKMAIAKFYIKGGTALKWKSLELGNQIEFTGMITNVFSTNMINSNSIRSPFLWVEIRECKPIAN